MLVIHTLDDIPELGEGPELATIEQRLGAFLIDTILNGGVLVAAFALSAWCSNGELWFNDSGGLFGFIPTIAILLLIWTVYVLSKVASTGQTVGKSQVGIKTVPIESIDDGQEAELGFGKAFVREIIGKNVLGSLTLGIGLLVPLFSERGQGLQDQLAGTIVVKSEEYEGWIYWMQHGTWLLERDQERQKERLELELKRIEDDKRFRTIQERERERINDESRTRREEVNKLFGKSETEDQRNERIQRQEHADRERRRKREQERIGDEEILRAHQQSEVERIIRENRASRHTINSLERKLGRRETDVEERERIKAEEYAECDLRKRFARAMGLIETDDEERADRERRVREAHEFRERERFRRETARGEREARERRVREDHERREREKVRRERYR